MFGREALEAAVRDHPESVPAAALLQQFHHFEAIHDILNGEWIYGVGGYMFYGTTYKYQRAMLKKQEALFRVGQCSKHILEIGVYLGHSLLILLASNPRLQITCIDNDPRFAPKVVDYLNIHFNNRITFILGDALVIMKDLPNNAFDAIHIDADHNKTTFIPQFDEARRLAIHGAFFVFNDYEALRPIIDDWIFTQKILNLVFLPWGQYTNIVTNILK
jgi:spermidine synthase